MDRKYWVNTFFSWLVFIGIDFLFHAALLKPFWDDPVPAIKSLEDLAILIPIGYASFYLLTLLIGYTFKKSFQDKPNKKNLFGFAIVWSALFSLSNFLGLYSYVNLPIKHLLLFNLVYFVEIFAVCFILYKLYFSGYKKRIKRNCVLLFFGLIILAIALQNIM